MNMELWLSALLQFLVVLPSAASCYYTVIHQIKYTPKKTAALCLVVLLPYCLLAACLHAAFLLDINLILLPCLVPFFFCYLHTVNLDFPRCLAIFVGVCAVQAFPGQFACVLDSNLHPQADPAFHSVEASLLQLFLACLIAALFMLPASRRFSRVVEHLDHPQVWYSTVILSAVFLVFNLWSVPHSYATVRVGRMPWLYPALEVCLLAILTSIYVLFYRCATLILEHSKLAESTWLLEMQARQYRVLLEYVQQTTRLRHDFRHSVRLLSALAKSGDIAGIRSYLAAYEGLLAEESYTNYCSNSAINALLCYYEKMASSEKIDMAWHIELPQPLVISELDLAALFGNLLENAIEGCKTLPEKKRYFLLTAEVRHKNWLYIVSTNSFDGNVQKGKDGYRSTKHSGKGTGLASIAAVAEKYNGSARFSNSDQKFIADVALKLQT